MLVARESIKIGEYGIAFHITWVTNVQMVRVGKHGANLLPNGVGIVAQVDAVA